MIRTIEDRGRSYRIHDPADEHIGLAIRRGRPYEHKLLRCIADLGLSGTAVDVGAHVGNHSLYLAAICGLRVVAYEPNESLHRALVANVDLNRKNVDVEGFPIALGAKFHKAEWVSEMALQVSPASPAGDVEVHSFDSLRKTDDISVVKIDVEGYECDALAGMVGTLSTVRPHVFSEVHEAADVAAQATILGPLGYSLDHFIHMGSRMAHWRAH